MAKFSITFIQILLFSLIELSLCTTTHIPSNKEIEVLEGGKYTLEIIEENTKNIFSCKYFANNGGPSGEFQVAKPEPEKYTVDLDENNQFMDFGFMNKCKIEVSKVNDKGPTVVTLIALDEKKTELHSADFKITFFYNVKLLKEGAIPVYEYQSFYQYMNVTTKFKSCYLQINESKYPLALHSEKPVHIRMSRSKQIDEVASKITSLGRGLCGFTCKEANNLKGLEWSLSAMDEENQQYRALFTVYTTKIEKDELNKEVVVTMGDTSFSVISCTTHAIEQKFCRLYHPSGKLVTTSERNTNCYYSLNTVRVDDLGPWKCLAESIYSMELIEFTITLVKADDLSMKKWINEQENYLSIGCQLPKTVSSVIYYCKMTSPSQEVFTLRPGIATNRYTSIGTDFKNNICAMEIRTPLEKSEVGQWKCEMGGSSGDVLGGSFLNVGNVTDNEYEKHHEIVTQLDIKLSIICEVPFASEYCHIKSPNGTIYYDKNMYHSWLGRCTLDIDQVEAIHSGRWTCSFARENGMPDEEIYVDVKIAEVLTSSTDVITAYENSNVFLLCSTGGLPIKYCRFISPDGKAYQIKDNYNESVSSIKYYGKGLDFGDCGMEISNVQLSASGTWTCATRIGNTRPQPEIKGEINVEVSKNLLSGSNLAIILGVTFGVVILSSILSVVFVRKMRRRSHTEMPGSSTQPRNVINDDDDTISQEDIFNLNIPGRSYTNPQFQRDEGHAHQY